MVGETCGTSIVFFRELNDNANKFGSSDEIRAHEFTLKYRSQREIFKTIISLGLCKTRPKQYRMNELHSMLKAAELTSQAAFGHSG